MELYRISVRNLVEFIFCQGDIDNRRGQVQSVAAMEAGSRIHRKIQQSKGSLYQSEVPLSIQVEEGLFLLEIEGRADGIEVDLQGHVTIDEIKGIYKDVQLLEEPIFVHKAQALVYGYIYSKQKQVEGLDIQLTYCNLDTEEIRYFREYWSAEKLQDFFQRVVDSYRTWLVYDIEHKAKRQKSIWGLPFPYPYRQGQRDLVVVAYKAMEQGRTLFIQASTGIGKTLANLYPAVMSMGQGRGDKLFYLTAKTITRTVAVDGMELLKENGLEFSYVVLTAKDKICPLEEVECNPLACPYAKGHFDRINEAVYDCITHEDGITREIILAYSEKHMVCPFEMSLDVSLWVDGIIGDYNYVFDPRVSLKRYFGQGVRGDYLFLVDEAHNLYQRASSMYSATLYKGEILSVRRQIKNYSKGLYRALGACNGSMLKLKEQCANRQVYEDIAPLVRSVIRALQAYEVFLEQHVDMENQKEILELYFHLTQFANIYELVEEDYVIYGECVGDDFKVKLYCVDTARNLGECIKKGRSTVFFSATMLPIQYYKRLLGQIDDYAIYAPSPFPPEHVQVLIGDGISTKYSRRGPEEYMKIFQYIRGFVDGRKGNYMLFFSSYQMLHEVYDIACTEGFSWDAQMICQRTNMSEKEREEFLLHFEGEGVVAFCIMGGIFSEGIDLTGERLIGAVIVGPGLPLVCAEQEILREYFQEHLGAGYAYAYLYPGMNKVLQAAGRVIRQSEDRGQILLLDERFLGAEYKKLFPREWQNYKRVTLSTIHDTVKAFWDR